MGAPGPSPEVTLDDALGIFTNLGQPSTPLTASEVGEELNCTRRTAHRKLEELAEQGDLESKKTGAHSRVWWRPAAARGGIDDAGAEETADLAEFGNFVTDVEDYAIFTLEPDGTVATWNEGARRIKGYEESEIVGEHFSTFYTEEDVEAGIPEENLAGAQEDGRIEDEGWRVRADGTQFWANVVITATRDEDGELQGYTKVTRDMTERREYEQRLQREQNRTQELLETAPIPIAVQDEDGNTVMANDRAQETLGLTESEFVHGPENEDEWTLYDADGDPVDPEEMPMARVLAAGEPVYDETIAIESPDGDRTWLSVNAAPFTGPDGDEARVVVAGEDVTALKERQRELETELSEVLGRISDAFYAVDDEWRFTHVNDQAAEILRQSEEALIGQELLEVFPDAADGVYWENLQQAMESQEPVSFEVHESDIDAWLEFNAYPSETGLSVYFRDVTDRKEYERELAKYGTIVETMNDGIYVKDENGQFTMVNDAYAEMTGYDRETLIGEHASLVVNEETIAESNARIGDEADPPMEAPIETADGETVPAEGTFSSLESGEEVGVVRDVTDRRRLESELDEVFGRVTDAFFALDRDWEFTYVNEKAHGVINPEGSDLEGKNVWKEFPDAIGRAFQEEYERAMYEQETVTFEEYYPEPLDAWYEVTAYPSETGLSVYFRDITEQKEAQRRLEEEHDMFAEGPAIVFRWGADAGSGWPVEYVSENVEDVLGYTPAELQSDNVAYTDLLLEKDLDRVDREVQEALDRGADRFTHEPYRVETSDGGVRWVKDITKIVRDDTGKVDHFLGYLVDITDRKEHERELAQYETIVETVNDGIYIVDDEGRFTMVNDAYAEMTGYDREQLIGEHVSLVVEEDVRELAKEIEADLSDGGTDEPVLEAELETASGEHIPSEATFSVLPSPEEGQHRIGVARDITERKEYERELERKERRYQAVFEDPNILVGLLEPDGTVLDINDTAMKYVDAELEELVGEQFSETPWWESDDGIQSDVREWVERAAAGEYVDFEADLTRPDGERYVLSGYFRPVTNDDGEVVSIIVSDRDITEQKEYQRELERSEQRYRTLVENFPNGAVGLVDENLRYKTVGGNPVDQESEGASDIEGKTIREALDPEFADAVEPHYRAALDGEASTFEVDQGDTVAQMQTYPVRDDDGEVFAALGMSQDITERVERERYLQDTKSRLEAATDAGAVGTWEWDIQEDVMVANPSFAETFGLDPDATTEGLSLDRFVERIHEDDRERVKRQIEEAVEERGEYEADYRVWTANGELRWVVARGHVETDENGTPTTFPGALTDITERKEYERQIEESERRYRTLVENFPDGAVGLFDEDLTYTAIGGELLELTDTARETRIGQSVHEIYPEALVEEVEPYFEAALDGESNSFETEYHDRYLFAHTLPVTDANDEVIGGMLVVQDVTERREAQQELRESEAKFRMISENLEEVVWMATPDAEEIVYLNPAFEKVWGIDRQQLYDESLSFIDRVHPEDREHVREEFTSLPEEDFDEEFRILRPDGEERWVNARGIQVTDEDSEMTRIVGIGKDVTGRVERERELERVLDLLEKTESIADVGGWEIDVDTQEVFWTDHVFDILGVDYDEEPPIDEALDMYHDEDQSIVEGAVEEAMTSGKSFDVEVRLDGAETGWIRLQGDPEVEDDDVVSFRGAAQDVTERVERERELEESERRYRTLAENFPNGAAGVYDSDLRYTLAGGAMLGEGLPPAEQLEGDRLPDIFPENVVEDLEPTFRAAVEDGETGTTTTEFGDRSWQVWAAPLRNAEGEIFAGLSLAQDITERIERERRLEELVDQLEESNERLERFAYVASHDLQEPLRMISNYLQLLERRYRDELDDEAEEFIDFAVDGAERMRDMISDLLAYSRLDTEAEPFEPTNSNAVVDDVRDDLQLRIEETDAEITVEDLPTVEVDENQFEMVFQNLVSNAIKYSGDDSPRIEIVADRRDDEWVFSVADDGIGMEQSHTEDVFDVFNRLHSHDEYPGTGIGLAMCEKIVRHHGGDIWVESEPGEGSTFYFTVPVDHGGRQN